MTGRGLVAFGLLLLGASPVWGAIELQKIEWQLSQKAKGQAPRYTGVPSLRLEGPRLSGKIRVQLTLLNRGPKAAEGILLRYSLSARLAPRGKAEAGVWAVPFMLGERRVPRVGPNQVRQVPLEPAMFSLYFRKLQRTGFWPDQIRIQVMLEPRAGDHSPIQTLESILPVSP